MEKTSLKQFIPQKYLYLTQTKKILYKGVNLKTDYLINIINELILKYYFHKNDLIDKEVKFNMWSKLLRIKYGSKYNYYINYLRDQGFMFLVSDYYKNKKARTYKLNTKELIYIKKCSVNDTILLKKTSKEYLKKTFLYYNNSTIDIEIREKLVNDLYNIKLDTESAKKYMDDLRDSRDISYNKYMKNIISIDNIDSGNIFFKFDEYGRMHTNFTILKKHLRQNFLTINNSIIDEIDLSNSQPLFLTVLMKKEMATKKLFSKSVSRYIDLVQNGLIYEELIHKGGLKDRNEAKIMMYKVLFGTNGHTKKENKLFYSLFPNVFEFIKDYKMVNNNYKTLSHRLQILESDFIFNKVVKHLYKSYPDISLFTIHDSICYPIKYRDDIREVFNYYRKNLLN